MDVGCGGVGKGGHGVLKLPDQKLDSSGFSGKT